MREQAEEAKQTKKGKRVAGVVSTVFVVLVVGLAVLMLGVRVVGLQPYAVLSGSMEPQIPVGALLYVKPCSADDVAVGDVITFVLNEDLMTATHRVVAIDTEAGTFTTKGDANETEDGAPVSFQNLIGKPLFAIPLVGYLSAYLSTWTGKIVGIGTVLLLLLILFLPERIFFGKRRPVRASANAK